MGALIAPDIKGSSLPSQQQPGSRHLGTQLLRQSQKPFAQLGLLAPIDAHTPPWLSRLSQPSSPAAHFPPLVANPGIWQAVLSKQKEEGRIAPPLPFSKRKDGKQVCPAPAAFVAGEP